MTTSFDKFRKLVAAYEDEVQRKQHKMGKRVDPRDEVQPNWTTAYCTFLRGQTVVWSPSFELIGTYNSSTRAWLWGWADPNVDPKLRTRIDVVRTQGLQWSIDLMTADALTLEGEQQAWELATVATALSRADAMYRVVDGEYQRFLALFDGAPASRSSTSMRAVRESQMNMPAVQVPVNPMPALARMATPMPRSSHTWAASPSPHGIGGAPPSAAGDEREPTTSTRAELGQRLFEAVPYAHQANIGSVNLQARATPPSGPVGTVAMDMRLVLTPAGGGPDIPLQPTPALNDSLTALWMRCRERHGSAYRFATARVEPGPQGLTAHVSLEW